MTLTKADLAENLVNGVGLNQREARDMVDAFFAEMVDALEAGQEVKLSNFGAFVTRDKVARPGRNPKSGVEVMVSARRVVTFHASSALKAGVDARPPDHRSTASRIP